MSSQALTFADVTAVKQIDSHTYEADFSPDWVIGSVPHGGYVTACVLTAVRKHFNTTLSKQDQPHSITLHLDFLRRTETGPANIKVKDVKLGRQTSIVHVTLSQGQRQEIVGYVTNSNLNTEDGVTFPTRWELHPQPQQITDFASLEADTDPNWGERKEWPFVNFRKAARQLRSWFPRQGQHSQSCLDMWYTFRDPRSRFTNESLGYVCDAFPQIIESYVIGWDIYGLDFERKYSPKEQRKLIKEAGFAQMWYPTLLLNLDVKKALPEEGVKWLFSRLEAKKIKNGRYDLEVLLLDAEGELVAQSHHVVFAVSAERNTAERRKPDSGNAKL